MSADRKISRAGFIMEPFSVTIEMARVTVNILAFHAGVFSKESENFRAEVGKGVYTKLISCMFEADAFRRDPSRRDSFRYLRSLEYDLNIWGSIKGRKSEPFTFELGIRQWQEVQNLARFMGVAPEVVVRAVLAKSALSILRKRREAVL